MNHKSIRIVGTVASTLAVGSLGYVVVAQPGAPNAAPATREHAAPATEHAALVSGVVGVGITVQDLEASVAYYRDVLGFRQVNGREEAGDGIEHLTGVFGTRRRTAVMQLGNEVLELSDYLAPEGRPIPVDSRSNDCWFQHVAIVVSDIDEAYAHLREHDVRHASTGPQTLPDWNPDAGGIKAFYFKDPDGHPLEIIWFPEGKGDPKWKRLVSQQAGPIFLGIDHTAIVVRDTETSLAFYQGVLGMHVAGRSENYGTEQEHLNNVFGARVRITGLRAASGMGVEFLEYLSPTTGRPYPHDSGANDVWHCHTVFTTTMRDAGESRMRVPAVDWVSSGAADPDGAGPQHAQVFVRDPDGHAVLLRVDPAQTTPTGALGNQPEALTGLEVGHADAR